MPALVPPKTDLACGVLCCSPPTTSLLGLVHTHLLPLLSVRFGSRPQSYLLFLSLHLPCLVLLSFLYILSIQVDASPSRSSLFLVWSLNRLSSGVCLSFRPSSAEYSTLPAASPRQKRPSDCWGSFYTYKSRQAVLTHSRRSAPASCSIIRFSVLRSKQSVPIYDSGLGLTHGLTCHSLLVVVTQALRSSRCRPCQPVTAPIQSPYSP